MHANCNFQLEEETKKSQLLLISHVKFLFFRQIITIYTMISSNKIQPNHQRQTASLNRSKTQLITRCSQTHSSQAERTAKLRETMARPGLLLGPACFDGMSARLIERAGFDFAFMSGFSLSAARLAIPDCGLLSYGEMVDQGRNINEATRAIPIIGDGDTGYGNAVNVKRTVKGYAQAGFAGILIEDQMWPKSCGHVRGKKVVEREEAVLRIQAACDERDEGSDIIIVARTDARQAASLEEALWRAAAFADAGADVVFVDALQTKDEMSMLCRQVKGGWKMANMLEGGGKTPILPPQELQDIGFKLCAYPLTLLGVSVRAMQGALVDLKNGAMPRDMPSFSELQGIVGFPEYFQEEARYAVKNSGGRSSSGGASSPPLPPPPPVYEVVEPDVVVEPGRGDVQVQPSKKKGEDSGYTGDRRSKWLRLKVTKKDTGSVQLDTRVPAGFLDGIAMLVPAAALAGVDLENLVKEAEDVGNSLLWTKEIDGDIIRIYLETGV